MYVRRVTVPSGFQVALSRPVSVPNSGYWATLGAPKKKAGHLLGAMLRGMATRPAPRGSAGAGPGLRDRGVPARATSSSHAASCQRGPLRAGTGIRTSLMQPNRAEPNRHVHRWEPLGHGTVLSNLNLVLKGPPTRASGPGRRQRQSSF